MTWTDAALTPKGVAEAEDARTFWERQIGQHKMPAPERYYVSPLYRALTTADITFSKLSLDPQRAYKPIVKEVRASTEGLQRQAPTVGCSQLLRESIGIHTCDMRRSKSFIQEHFPSYTFERGFAETDPLWKPDVRESDSSRDARLKELLDDILTTDHSTYISLTSHSGAINSILHGKTPGSALKA